MELQRDSKKKRDSYKKWTRAPNSLLFIYIVWEWGNRDSPRNLARAPEVQKGSLGPWVTLGPLGHPGSPENGQGSHGAGRAATKDKNELEFGREWQLGGRGCRGGCGVVWAFQWVCLTSLFLFCLSNNASCGNFHCSMSMHPKIRPEWHLEMGRQCFQKRRDLGFSARGMGGSVHPPSFRNT